MCLRPLLISLTSLTLAQADSPPPGDLKAEAIALTLVEQQRERSAHRLLTEDLAPLAEGKVPGPDGRFYWAEITSPTESVIKRSRLDGSHVDTFARGFARPRALAFNHRGDLYVLDAPAVLGQETRLYHVVEGADTGWRAVTDMTASPWMRESYGKPSFPGQTAAIVPCLSTLSPTMVTLAFHPGTALTETWEELGMLADEARGLRLFTLEPAPERAVYQVSIGETVTNRAGIEALVFSDDGALYTPLKEGDALAWDGDPPHPLRPKTAEWFRENWRRLPEGVLLDLLGYPDQRLRLAAQNEIVRRHDYTILRNTALTDSRLQARLHAIWGCAQLARERDGESLQPIASLAGHPNAAVRAQTLKALGDTRAAFAREPLLRGLFDSDARVRFEAGMALHHLGRPQDLPDIIAFVAAQADTDSYQRFAGIRAMTGAARDWPDLLVDYQDHEKPAVRQALAVALRFLYDDLASASAPEEWEGFAPLIALLADTDESVAMEAARAIHDVAFPHPALLDALAKALETAPSPRRSFAARQLNANRLIGSEEAAARVVAYAADAKTPAVLRDEALKCLETWSAPLTHDPVLRTARPVPPGRKR